MPHGLALKRGSAGRTTSRQRVVHRQLSGSTVHKKNVVEGAQSRNFTGVWSGRGVTDRRITLGRNNIGSSRGFRCA